MKHSYWLVSRLGWIACLLAGALFTGGCSKEAEEEVAATPRRFLQFFHAPIDPGS